MEDDRAGGASRGASMTCCAVPVGVTTGHTGQIGSRQQLAENVWLVSLGRCGGSYSGLAGPIYTQSNSGCREKPYFEKSANFPYMHVEMG